MRTQSDFKKWHLVLDFRPISEKRFLIAPRKGAEPGDTLAGSEPLRLRLSIYQ